MATRLTRSSGGSVGCMASEGSQLPADGLGDMHPEVRGEPERGDVDALVVAVEARAKHLNRYLAAEQSRAVRDDALLPEEAGILILFYEYFHGDNGAGLGASHQTGWTGLIARLLDVFGRLSAADLLEAEKG